MRTRNLMKLASTALSVLPLLLVGAASTAQEEPIGQQVLSQGLLGGFGLAEPAFVEENRPPSYDFFVGPGQTYRVAQFGDGSISVLDSDNVVRRIAADGSEIIDNAFPVACTNILVNETKNNGQVIEQSLSSCSSMIALSDGSFRLFGADKGKKLVAYKYVPSLANCPLDDPATMAVEGWNPATDPIEDRFCWGAIAIEGAPPQAAEAVEDKNEFTLERTGAETAYWLVADKSKIYLVIPGEVTDTISLIQKINGKNLTGIATFNDGVVVVDDDGVLYEITKDATGTWMTAEWTSAAFGPNDLEYPDGNKTEQKITLQSDEREGLLYIANRAAGEVDILTAAGSRFTETLVLDGADSDSAADFFPEDIDVIGAVIGTWDSCTTSSGGFCQIGEREDEAYIAEADTFTSDGSGNTYTAKKFVLQDCRWEEGTLPAGEVCPIIPGTCQFPSDGTDDIRFCDLDVIKLALIADPTFADLLPEPVPVSVLPWWLRSDLDIPPSAMAMDPNAPVDNKATFFYYHVRTNAAFEGLATATYDIDLIRSNLEPEILADAGDETCPDPLQERSVIEVNEQSTMITYLPDTYESVRCDISDPSAPCSLTKSAYITIESCINPRSARSGDWSGHIVGVESALEDVYAFGRIAELQNAELQAFKDKVLCNVDYEINGTFVGRILADEDCTTVQSKLDQIAAKLATCLDASNPSQGSSAENCNALNTQVTNLETVLPSLGWPTVTDPGDPLQFLLADRNPRGEFIARLEAFSYSVNYWWQSSNAAPLVAFDSLVYGDTVVEGDILYATADDLEDSENGINLTDYITWSVDGVPVAYVGGSPTTTTDLGLTAPGPYLVTISVTDSDGLTSSASIEVFVDPL